MEASPVIIWANKLSFIVLGGLVVGAVRLPLSILITIAAICGLTHGFDNTAGLAQPVSLGLFLPGLVTSGLSAVAIFAAVAVSRNRGLAANCRACRRQLDRRARSAHRRHGLGCVVSPPEWLRIACFVLAP